jgi:hypothetical protein
LGDDDDDKEEEEEEEETGVPAVDLVISSPQSSFPNDDSKANVSLELPVLVGFLLSLCLVSLPHPLVSSSEDPMLSTLFLPHNVLSVRVRFMFDSCSSLGRRITILGDI